MTILQLVKKQELNGLESLTLQELKILNKAFIKFDKESPKESYFDGLDENHWAHIVEQDMGDWNDRIEYLIRNGGVAKELTKNIKVNTINELLKDGWVVENIYKGDLNSCACGCAGNYYKEGEVSERSFKIMTNKVNAFIEEHGDNEVGDLQLGEISGINEQGAHLIIGKFDPATWGSKDETPYKEVNIQWATREQGYEESRLEGFRIYLRKDRTPQEMVSKETIKDYQEMLERESIDRFENLDNKTQQELIKKYLDWAQINQVIALLEHPDFDENMYEIFEEMDFWLESLHYEAMYDIAKGDK